MLNLEARRLDRELWSFLNLNLTGEAKVTFNSIPRLHGFEAWRQVVVPIEPRTLHRKMGMYMDVHHPARARNLGDVTACIKAWEKVLVQYARCGGRPLPEEEKCFIALQLLPLSTPPGMMLTLRGFQSFDGLKHEIDNQLSFLNETTGLSHKPLFATFEEQVQQREAEGLQQEDVDGRRPNCLRKRSRKCLRA